jgi:hypothetical protein
MTREVQHYTLNNIVGLTHTFSKPFCRSRAASERNRFFALVRKISQALPPLITVKVDGKRCGETMRRAKGTRNEMMATAQAQLEPRDMLSMLSQGR